MSESPEDTTFEEVEAPPDVGPGRPRRIKARPPGRSRDDWTMRELLASAPPPPPPTVIPEGDPATAALGLLAEILPGTVGELKARLETLDAELGGIIEAARLDTGITMRDVLNRSARTLRTHAVLRARLNVLSPGDQAPDRPDLPTAVTQVVRSVRRWRGGDALRVERARLIERAERERISAENELTATIQTIQRGCHYAGHIYGTEHQAGLNAPSDEGLRQLEKIIQRGQAARARVATLDAHGDAARAATIAKAIGAAGGPEAIVAVLAPHQAGREEELAKSEQAIATLAERHRKTDPETHRAAEQAVALKAEQERLQALRKRSEADKVAKAGPIVRDALTGRLAGLATLSAALAKGKINPELAATVNAIRGSDPELVAVVSEILDGR